MEEVRIEESKVSTRTVTCYFNTVGYFYLQTRKKGLLIEDDHGKRVKFAKDMQKKLRNRCLEERTCFLLGRKIHFSLQAGSSVENGARSKYKGLVTSQKRGSLQRSHSFFSVLRSESGRKLLIGQFVWQLSKQTPVITQHSQHGKRDCGKCISGT